MVAIAAIIAESGMRTTVVRGALSTIVLVSSLRVEQRCSRAHSQP
jgi:hypothetical protein